MTEPGTASARPAAEEAAEILSALRQAASPEQTAALVAALYVARSRAADSTAASAYQDNEASGAGTGAARHRDQRRLRAA